VALYCQTVKVRYALCLLEYAKLPLKSSTRWLTFVCALTTGSKGASSDRLGLLMCEGTDELLVLRAGASSLRRWMASNIADTLESRDLTTVDRLRT
jgi:hypothetical protein